MKRFYQMGLIVAVISVLSFVSCGVHSKNSYLKEFKSFVDKVENTDFETEADWNEALKSTSGLPQRIMKSIKIN